ncbi:bacteriocin [Lactobacillus sp.]|nr:bacteriocin [Lactobacillus sp.]MBD5429940.1 bacteriocin [Lactobacillus sp.]
MSRLDEYKTVSISELSQVVGGIDTDKQKGKE